MPTRSRAAAAAAAATAPEVDEPEESPVPTSGLQFNQPLSWPAARPIPVGELLKRLQALSKELRSMEQEENERDSFTKVAKELAAKNLLSHKDKGDIFTMFITSILPALSDPSNAYNSQHIYVIQSLAEVKSIVLLTDIPNSEHLLLHIFTSFFDIMSGSSKASNGEQLGKNVEYHMNSILVILVDESSSVPAEVVDIIIAQFLRADPRAVTSTGNKTKKNGMSQAVDEKQSTLLLKELPPAYNMAKSICNSCPEKMARYISQYFNDVIMDASASSVADGAGKNKHHRRASDDQDDSDDEGPSGPTEEDLKELHKAHRLLRELWRASPPVLQNVIPQLEAELSAENVQLRLLATETLGDIVSGIGAAGPPPPPPMDPAAYPPTTLATYDDRSVFQSIMTTPCSPQPFPQTHSAAYNSFVSRQKDKSSLIRSAWTMAIGKIITTSAGGVGLSQTEEQALLASLGRMLIDSEERVRIAAVKAIESFSFRDIIMKLGSLGDMTQSGSILANLADRAKDRKHAVRVEAMKILGRIWGVSAGEIAAGNETVVSKVGAVPTKIFDTFYVNDQDINVLLDHVLYEFLLPLSYPPVKSKGSKMTNGDSQRVKDSQANGEDDHQSIDVDKIRAERILVLVKDLDVRAKKAFFACQGRQKTMAQVMETYLKRCEQYNGGVMESSETEIKSHLTRIIDYFAKVLPDGPRVTADLWKFAKMHDRRSYQLIRFCMSPESDYKTVYKAIREFSKRIEAAPGAAAGMLETLTPLLYRVSLLIYNKSHVPAIMEVSRTDGHPLSGTAHELLKEISSFAPEVFKAHVRQLCRIIEDQAPTSKKPNEPGAIDTLKACAAFAQKFPAEISKERKFLQSLVSFALHGTPAQAAKHAVSIIMAASERKELYARELLQKATKDFQYGSDGFLARLATLSQLVLLAPNEVDEESDAVVDIAINQILLKVRTTAKESEKEWETDIDDECHAKMWALKILVNRLRSNPDPESVKETAEPVYKLLNTLIAKRGELSKKNDTPAPQKARLRLLAAQLILKLCRQKHFDDLLTPSDFNRLACTAQDSQSSVRSGFVNKLKKYLGLNKLSRRFYTIVFLLAFEPQHELREDTVTWLRSRAAFLAERKSTAMESVFVRLLSLLAHHPDYSPGPDDLADFANYILFYLQPVATEENLSLIYHAAQRVKQTRDAIDPSKSENLYHLSDLAQAIIRRFEDAHGWSLTTWPGKLALPDMLFAALPSHDVGQEIAMKNYLPEELVDRLDGIVKRSLRAKNRKRRSEHPAGDDSGTPAKKKPKSSSTSTTSRALALRKTPKSSKPKRAKKDVDDFGENDDDDETPVPSSERRRSGRNAAAGKTYAERDDEEDDQEMEDVGGVVVVGADEEAEEGSEEVDDDDEEEEGGEGEKGEPEEEDGGAVGGGGGGKGENNQKSETAKEDVENNEDEDEDDDTPMPDHPIAAHNANPTPSSSTKSNPRSTKRKPPPPSSSRPSVSDRASKANTRSRRNPVPAPAASASASKKEKAAKPATSASTRTRPTRQTRQTRKKEAKNSLYELTSSEVEADVEADVDAGAGAGAEASGPGSGSNSGDEADVEAAVETGKGKGNGRGKAVAQKKGKGVAKGEADDGDDNGHKDEHEHEHENDDDDDDELSDPPDEDEDME
ncbi:MAG: hypothetical protein M1819_004272 [Sarea resinae]|nr:MAG: hypothetical protein M1819_004272 [Sarea resinae]